MRDCLNLLDRYCIVLWYLGTLVLLYWDKLDLLGLCMARPSDLGIALSQQWLTVLQERAVYKLSCILDLDWSLEICLEVASGQLRLWLGDCLITWANFDLIY